MCQFTDTHYSCGCLESRTRTFCTGQTCSPEEEDQCWTLSENCAECQAAIDDADADAEALAWIGLGLGLTLGRGW